MLKAMFWSSALAVLAYGAVAHERAVAQTVLKVDALEQSARPEAGYFRMGTATSPNGHTIGINNRYLTRDGKPWMPVMGEFHFTRFPPEYWEEEILKMKSAGVDIISTYLFWNHHEEKAGVFNWSGDRDARKFAALCAKHDVKLFIRIGPWSHGEARFGGTPDWVVEQMRTRRNDPVYMKYVARYWGEVAQQLKGQFWKDGGAIIGVQFENEYNRTGPGAGAEHIQALKDLALSLGFDVPLYTVTGWDGAVYPKREVTPVFAGYPDEPWGVGTTKMDPNEVYLFRFNNRTAGDAGAETKAMSEGTAIEDLPHTPFLGAEYGGGLSLTYRRRPILAPDDIGAMWPVQLGSGVNLYGYYMFHGGRQPKGLGRLEENGLLGAYKDLPAINYDYGAAYGQYGQARPVLGVMRPFHLFAKAFGDRLAPMQVHAPEKRPSGRDDFVSPRFSVRSAGDSGFVFMSNYIRQYPMASQDNVQFEIALPGGKVKFPSKPITIPDKSYFIWPFNFDLDGINLAWATAQPLTRLETAKNEVTYFFAATKGIMAEFAFTKKDGVRISGKGLTAHGDVSLARLTPSKSVAIKLKIGAKTVSIVVLSHTDAAYVWQGRVGGMQRLLLSPDTIMFNRTGVDLRSTGNPRFELGVFPALTTIPTADMKLSLSKDDGVFQSFMAQAKPKTITPVLVKLRDAEAAPEVNIGGSIHTAVQPYPEAFGRAAAWSISVPSEALEGVADAFLDIGYQGDIARLFSGTEMLDDQFFFAPTWTVGLKRFSQEIKSPLTLTVMPLRKDAPIYIDEAVKASLPTDDQVARVLSVKVTPQYGLNLVVQ